MADKRRRPCPAPPVRSRRPARHARRVRWGGETVVTERDVVALRWLAEQFGARSDVLRVLLGRLSPGGTQAAGIISEATLRQIVARWSTGNLVHRHRLLGWQWTVPTGKAMQLVGLDFPVWTPVVTQLAHVHAVGIVRLHAEPTIPAGGRWVSERELRRDADRRQVPDGAVELPATAAPAYPTDPYGQSDPYGQEIERPAPRVAVEVELTRKSTVRLRDLLNRPRHGRYLRTVYFSADDVAPYLEHQIAHIRPRHPVEVRRLPHVEGTTYGGAV